jgi:hypothetical protein
MNAYEKYRQTFCKLLELTEQFRFKEIENDETILVNLSSISNTEMYFTENRVRIANLSNDILKTLVISLSNLENKYYRGREKDWYFVNTFSQFRAVLSYRLNDLENEQLMDFLLKNRRNERMPFAKDLSLNIKEIEAYKEFLENESERTKRHIKQSEINKRKKSLEKVLKQEHYENSQVKSQERNKYLDWFNTLCDNEKILEIISNNKPINFYSEQLDFINETTLNDLNETEIGQLIELIKKSKDRRFNDKIYILNKKKR